jgi:ABC-2 type transport system ATP-binding protein
MDEAERLSDRLAILDHGSVLVEGTPRQIIATLGGDHIVEFDSVPRLASERLWQLPAVTRVDGAGGLFRLATRESHRTIQALLQLIGSEGGELTTLNTHHATLDDVFLAQTGRQLRDA